MVLEVLVSLMVLGSVERGGGGWCLFCMLVGWGVFLGVVGSGRGMLRIKLWVCGGYGGLRGVLC